jgi:predicted lipoprotein with Yx(FWY)xxD motif
VNRRIAARVCAGVTATRGRAATALALSAAATGAAVLAALAPAASAAPTATTTVVATRHTGLGTFLVDGKGRTLYLFDKDSKNVSRCSGACAKAWPPALVSGKLTATGKVNPKLLGSIKRANGTHQLTYKGHPLYRFVADARAGQTKGAGLLEFGARWYVVQPSGNKIDNA